jgi:tRNA-dihydrouridine synthase B
MPEALNFCGLKLPNNIFLAPLAGITTRPFRMISLSLGAGLAWTEMISAEGLIRGEVKTKAYLPAGDEGGAVAVQIFGHRPESLRDAAAIAAATPAVIVDINMGCPVRKVVRSGSGAALMKDPLKVEKIVAAVCGAVEKPVSVKIRSGWDEGSINAVEIAKAAEGAGAAAVTVHPRTARQGFRGTSDWSVITAVARAVKIPVVGSGDLTTPAGIAEALSTSGCAAVMIGRAALGRPWIFRDAVRHLAGEAEETRGRGFVAALMLRHLELNVQEFGARRGVLLIRSPLAWYSRGM